MRRQYGGNCFRLLNGNMARASLVKHQTDRIRSGFRRRQRIGLAGDAANFYRHAHLDPPQPKLTAKPNAALDVAFLKNLLRLFAIHARRRFEGRHCFAAFRERLKLRVALWLAFRPRLPKIVCLYFQFVIKSGNRLDANWRIRAHFPKVRKIFFPVHQTFPHRAPSSGVSIRARPRHRVAQAAGQCVGRKIF